jgi:hypothetical protein
MAIRARRTAGNCGCGGGPGALNAEFPPRLQSIRQASVLQIAKPSHIQVLHLALTMSSSASKDCKRSINRVPCAIARGVIEMAEESVARPLLSGRAM